MKKYIILSFIALAVVSQGSAQNLGDAIRFSTFDVFGTARNMSVGSSMGALGADFGAISQNPAGLATFRKSEFTFTPYVPFSTSRSTLLGDGSEETESFADFRFSNFGVVLANKPRNSRWKTVNLAIGLNQVASFNEKFYFDGVTPGSITYRFVDVANGLTPEQLDDFEGYPAFITGAIYDFENDLIYENDFMLAGEDAPVAKRQESEAMGRTNELSISFGANFDEGLQFGVGIGVPFFSYISNKSYAEDDDQDMIPFFDNLEFTEFLETSGTGLNFRLGAIVNFSREVRWGLSFQSATNYRLNDNYATAFVHQYTQDGTQTFDEENSPSGSFNYRYKSPMRVSTSLAAILNRSGFVSVEAEYVPMRSALFRLDDDPAYEVDLNNQIFDEFKAVFNIKGGGEYAYKKFRIRAGLQVSTSPYFDESDLTLAYSGGIGFRGDRSFIDLGYRLYSQTRTYRPYNLPDALGYAVEVEQTILNHHISATLGFKL